MKIHLEGSIYPVIQPRLASAQISFCPQLHICDLSQTRWGCDVLYKQNHSTLLWSLSKPSG